MKKVIINLILIVCAATSQAQNFSFTSAVDKNLMQSVAGDALYLVQQDYYLLDTTSAIRKKFGQGNLPYFGRFYFLAIAADGKFYTDPNINTPWKLDPNFKTINAANKYVPVLSDLAYRGLGDKQFKKVDSTFTLNRKADSMKESTYAVLEARNLSPGLKLATVTEAAGDSTAWFWTANNVSGKSTGNKQDSNSVTLLDFEASKGKFIPTRSVYANSNFSYSDNTMGGFIFTTKASLGKIDFFLHGIITKRPDGKFDFVPIKKPAMLSSSLTKPEKETVESLTPIEENVQKPVESNVPKKKKKKNGND